MKFSWVLRIGRLRLILFLSVSAQALPGDRVSRTEYRESQRLDFCAQNEQTVFLNVHLQPFAANESRIGPWSGGEGIEP